MLSAYDILYGSLLAKEVLAIDALTGAVETEHRCSAPFVRSVVVWELLKGEIVEERTVYPFDLEGHEEAPAAMRGAPDRALWWCCSAGACSERPTQFVGPSLPVAVVVPDLVLRVTVTR